MRRPGVGLPFGREWKRPYTVLLICVGAYFAVRFAQVIVGPVVPLLIEEFGVTRGAIGTVLTGMWVAYALTQLPSGGVADRYGEGRTVIAALVITGCATLALAAAPTFPVFAVAVICIGIGAGAYYNPATTLLTRHFDGIGGAIGTHRVGGQLAGVIAPLGAALLAVRYGWRTTIVLGALLAILVAAVFSWSHRPSRPSRSATPLGELFAPRPLLDLLARPHTRRTTFVMTLVEFAGLATMAFLPTFFVEHYGFSIGRANFLFAVFFATSALCQPIGGRLSDWLDRDGTILVLVFAGFVGYAGLAVGTSFLVAFPAVVLAGVANSSTPVIQSRMLDGLSRTNQGLGFGLFRTLYMLLGASGTAVVGVTADVAGWTLAFGLLAGLLAIVVLFVFVVRTLDRRDAYRRATD